MTRALCFVCEQGGDAACVQTMFERARVITTQLAPAQQVHVLGNLHGPLYMMKPQGVKEAGSVFTNITAAAKNVDSTAIHKRKRRRSGTWVRAHVCRF